MTKEENIATLNEHLDHWKRLLSEKICNQSEGEKTIDALQNAIKALEQEPCEVSQGLFKDSQGFSQEPCDDAISRQAVLDALDKSKYSNEFCEEHHIDWSINLGMAHIVVNELKPVTPQPKMGRWIYRKEEDSYRCSLCNFPCHKDNMGALPTRYCAECGAIMQEVEE